MQTINELFLQICLHLYVTRRRVAPTAVRVEAIYVDLTEMRALRPATS